MEVITKKTVIHYFSVLYNLKDFGNVCVKMYTPCKACVKITQVLYSGIWAIG